MLKERTHLRDHEAGGRRLRPDRAGPGQAQRPARPPGPRPRPGLSPGRGASCSRSSRASRPWPIARRRSTTRTSRRWPRPRSTADPALWTLDSFHTSAGTGTIPMAAVCPAARGWPQGSGCRLRRRPRRCRFQDHRTHHRASPSSSRDYQVRSVTVGEDAQGEARVEVEYNGRDSAARPSAPTSSRPAPRLSSRRSIAWPCAANPG